MPARNTKTLLAMWDKSAHLGAAPKRIRISLPLCLLCLSIFFLGSLQPAPGEESAATTLDRADGLIRQGKTEDALVLLRPLAQTEPRVAGVEAKLGKAYFTSKQYQQAALHLQLAIQEAPEDWEATQLLALTYYAQGDCRETLPLLLKVSAHMPKEGADAPYVLGVCYLRTKQWDEARKAFARMFGVSPESPIAHLMLAKMMVKLQLEDQAAAEASKALDLDPRLPMTHFLLGELYLSRSDPQHALEEFQKELEINPTVWLVYWRLGDAYMRLKQYDDAEKALKQALWLNESFTGSYLMLGEIELQKGDAGLASGFLERAVKLDPQNYYAHYFLARAYQQLGRTMEAGREFELQRSLREDNRKVELDAMEERSHQQ